MTKERKLLLTLCDGLPHELKVQTHIGIRTLSGRYNNDRQVSIDAVILYPHKPILFDLYSLTKPITIGGETFVPMRLFEIYENQNIEYIIEEILTGLAPVIIIEKLKEWKFNVRGLDPDQFINIEDLETNPYE